MSTISKTFDARDAVAEEAGGGPFERAFRRMVSARESRARALIDGHLAQLSDASLIELGYEPIEIRRIRGHAAYPSYYWI